VRTRTLFARLLGIACGLAVQRITLNQHANLLPAFFGKDSWTAATMICGPTREFDRKAAGQDGAKRFAERLSRELRQNKLDFGNAERRLAGKATAVFSANGVRRIPSTPAGG
jgi:hypothetical protein